MHDAESPIKPPVGVTPLLQYPGGLENKLEMGSKRNPGLAEQWGTAVATNSTHRNENIGEFMI